MRLLAVVALLVVLVGSGHAPAWAQAAGWYLTPSFRLTEEFDDNIFARSSGKESDFISVFSPGIEAGYRSEPFTLLVNSGFEADIFAEHPELNDATSAWHAGFNLRYLPIRPLTLGLHVAYVETNRPSSLPSDFGPILIAPVVSSAASPPSAAPPPSAGTPPSDGSPPSTVPPSESAPSLIAPATVVEFGRRRATFLSASPSAVYHFTPLTTGSAAYTYSHSTIEGGVANTTHSTGLSLSHQLTALDTGTLGFRVTVFESEGVATRTSYTPTLGWTRKVTPETTLSLSGGPRFSDGSVGPEVSARLDREFKLLRVSLGYSRSEGFVVGQAGAVNTETYSGSVNFVPLRSLLVAVGPTITRISGGTTSDTTIYALGATASYQILRWLTARASYRFAFQERAGGDILHNVFSLGLEASYPYRIGQ